MDVIKSVHVACWHIWLTVIYQDVTQNPKPCFSLSNSHTESPCEKVLCVEASLGPLRESSFISCLKLLVRQAGLFDVLLQVSVSAVQFFLLLFSPLYTLWEWSSELQLCFWFHSAVMCLTADASLRFPSQFLAVSPLKRDKSKSTAGGSQAASQTQNTHRNTQTNPVCETVISSCLGLQWPLSLLLKATSGLKVQRQRR